MLIRDEAPLDAGPIGKLVTSAFQYAPHSSHTEAAIVDALREAGVLVISLVADKAGEVVGHIGFSPVEIDGRDMGWFGLGPLSVLPGEQGKGIGAALVHEGLQRLKTIGARGCVVLGDPMYYGRFGFKAQAGLVLADVPPEYFQALPFGGVEPHGVVTFHAGFAAS
ncbi:N-acetyltransferase [Rhizobium sp. KVB221]|uniref:N-acetyltransferase n=1 Tax=Rhizobium setariae TaxID=2801340 RepID=A0A937CNM0_9HYPH|nr:N-acetyltransferase [Rhizobium setariae]MBL0372129.1 N-acetyltransferase [Rhizobium setariae]